MMQYQHHSHIRASSECMSYLMLPFVFSIIVDENSRAADVTAGVEMNQKVLVIIRCNFNQLASIF